MKRIVNLIFKDSLGKNSFNLILSTLIMSIFGFVFWIINSRLFSATQIGLATTIISVMSFITSISLFGLGTAIIRYLPSSERKNDKINTVFTLVFCITIILTTIFLVYVNYFSPKLEFIKENIVIAFIFIIFMIFNSLSSIIDSIFIAFRNTKYILIKNSIFSVGKLIFPFLLISFGAFGLFSSWMIALMLGFFFSFLVLIFKFSYKPEIVFYDSIIKRIGKFSFTNYVSGIIAGLPLLLIPIILTNYMSPEKTAYYYISMMIANFIYTIPSATTNSLFAEGSNKIESLGKNLKKAVKIISMLIIPAIIFSLIFGKIVLGIFGENYIQASSLLYLLAIAGIFVSINSIFSTLFRINQNLKKIIISSIISCSFILVLIFLFIDMSLTGIGIAWLLGQILSCIANYIIYKV